MNETDNAKAETSSVRVNDRRRFDPDGNARPEAEGPAQAASSSSDQNPGVADPEGSADEPVAAQPENPLEGELRETQQQLEAARKRVDELARAYQALMQDREDFKRRLSREREQMLDVEKGNVAQVLLQTADELDLSLNAAGPEQSGAFAQGVRLIRDGLLQRLQGMGLERLNVVDQPYDPNTAEAADMEITADPERDQWVVAELRAGYRLKDRIVRPARVKVAKYVKPADA